MDTETAGGGVALAASLATLITKSVLHPIDTLKCRIQLFSGRPQDGSRWRGVLAAHRGKWGPRYLYSGLPVKLLLYVPYQSFYMSSYNYGRTLLEVDAYRQQQEQSAYLWRTAAAAVFAELCSSVVRVPMETLKVRIQGGASENTHEAVRQFYRHGWRANVRLMLPQTFLHDIPYSITQWLLYETLRPYTQRFILGREEQGTPQSGWQQYKSELFFTFCSGGFSGMVAAAVTVPLDTIRTQYTVLSSKHNNRPYTSGSRAPLTVRHVIGSIYRRGGLKGFYAGGGTRVVWVSMNMSMYFPLFEMLKRVCPATA
ncbi:solute carrier family 25 (mitochondrial S-adenosylmethionine transporter), member 26 [Angomonas deanei]|nr:solute carrier family 25 (mitochondrial S-adenosylmethionine transporter), member 26 [Angomonas deanei]|eukprot:EPY34997.1 solute carrier family 25 (mitochondrial S-adenosylmethionine transporter), member 26 [Angomonas deanei]